MNRYLLPPLVLLASCNYAPLCTSKVREVARDLRSDRYATTETRNCGATTDYTTIIRVGRNSQSPKDAEEVLVADSNHGDAGRGGLPSIWTSVTWTSPGHLQIAYSSRARVFRRVATSNGATISFRATEPYPQPPVP